jgi:hypothetical protein
MCHLQMKGVTNTRKLFSEWLVHDISRIVVTKKCLFVIFSYRKYMKYDSKYGIIKICNSINTLQLQDEYINITCSNYFKNDSLLWLFSDAYQHT